MSEQWSGYPDRERAEPRYDPTVEQWSGYPDPRYDPTVEQWARAEALRSVAMTSPDAPPRSIAMMVNAYAALIMTGELPAPPAGVMW